MKKSSNVKIRLVLTVAVCVLFVVVTFSSVVGKIQSDKNFATDNQENADDPLGLSTPMLGGLFNFRILNRDWDYWSNKPHLFSMPEGNVGIGTNDPQTTLDIYDFDAKAEIRLLSGLMGGSGVINFANSGWVISSGFASPPQSLSFEYEGDKVMTLQGDKVGINTTTPSATLHVVGDTIFEGDVHGVDNRQEVFRLKTGSYSTSNTSWVNFTGANGTANIVIDPIVWCLSICGHYADNDNKYVDFRLKFHNDGKGETYYVPDISGSRKYMYVDHNRLEEFTMHGVSNIPRGTYSVQLQLKLEKTNPYQWGSSYGPVVLVIW